MSPPRGSAHTLRQICVATHKNRVGGDLSFVCSERLSGRFWLPGFGSAARLHPFGVCKRPPGTAYRPSGSLRIDEGVCFPHEAVQPPLSDSPTRLRAASSSGPCRPGRQGRQIWCVCCQLLVSMFDHFGCVLVQWSGGQGGFLGSVLKHSQRMCAGVRYGSF